MTSAGGGSTGRQRWADLAGQIHRLLPLWFVGWSAVRIQQLGWTGQAWDLSFVGRDFWIYRNAGLAILDGTDPWLASFPWNGTDWHFAAPPIAAQLFVPFALLPAALSLGVFLAISVVAAWAALRSMGVPAWWLLFPPMTEGILAANPQILLFGLVVLGASTRRIPVAADMRLGLGGWLAARAASVGLKIYGIVPIVARREWSALAASVALIVASIAIAPGLWGRYLTGFADISSRIVRESEGGLSAALLLQSSVFGDLLPSPATALLVGVLLYGLIVGLVFLAAARDVEGAGWLAAPLLWPAAEYHLATMAIPAMRRGAAWLIAIPTIPTYLLGLIVLAYQITAGQRSIAATAQPIGLGAWLRTLGIDRRARLSSSHD